MKTYLKQASIIAVFICFSLVMYFKTSNSKQDIDIDRAINYPIPHVIERYKKDYGVSDEIAQMHERELKRYLIISAINYPTPIDMFSKEVDHLWHTFILFTEEYEKYCKEMFGRFIHHAPKTHIL